MKKKLAQYFTPTAIVDFMIQLADLDSQSQILEPACGEGIFLERLQAKGYNNITAYEIDDSLAQQYETVQHESFVSAEISQQFDVVIGNPPYIRWRHLDADLKLEVQENALWKAHCNSLCDYFHVFVLRAIDLLKENGQLLFICPEYWMNTTHSKGLRNYMVERGYFEAIYRFKETPIFEGVNISCVVFKYIKSQAEKPSIQVTNYESKQTPSLSLLENLSFDFSCPPFQKDATWLIVPTETQQELEAFEQKCQKQNGEGYHSIGEFCEIGNGMVSGLDKAFQWKTPTEELEKQEQHYLLKVVKAKDLQPFQYNKITPYVFLNEIDSETTLKVAFPNFYFHFQEHRPRLEIRYQYKRFISYWHWVFPRNQKLFSQQQPRILVPCKERVSNKDYFRFALAEADIYPTQDVTALLKKADVRESIQYILAFLNHPKVFHWLCHKGIVKGNIVEFSERPLSSIPFRAINWADKSEVALHDAITKACSEPEIDSLFVMAQLDKLLRK